MQSNNIHVEVVVSLMSDDRQGECVENLISYLSCSRVHLLEFVAVRWV